MGIRVDGRDDDGKDVFDVYLTSGSNGSEHSKLIGTFTAADLNSEVDYAAAPELLEALEDMLDDSVHPGDQRDQARAAIAQAKGE